MADPILVPITSLPIASTLSGAELMPVVQGGVTKSSPVANVAFLQGDIALRHLPLPLLNNAWMLASAPLASSPTFGTVALTFGTTLFVPFAVGHTITLSNIAVDVTTAAGVVHLGIYSALPAGGPDQLLASVMSLSTATTGIKSAAMAVQLQPGLYWLAVAAPGSPSPTLRSQSGGAPMLGVASAGSQTPIRAYRASTANLPATATAPTTNITAAPPAVWLRFSEG